MQAKRRNKEYLNVFDPSAVLRYSNLNMRISNYGVQNAYRFSTILATPIDSSRYLVLEVFMLIIMPMFCPMCQSGQFANWLTNLPITDCPADLQMGRPV